MRIRKAGFGYPMRSPVLYFCVAILFAVFCQNADSRDDVWEKLMAAQKKFHEGVYQVFVKAHPDLEYSCRLEKSLQTALVDKKREEFYYLLENDPKRINRSGGVEMLEKYSWREFDGQKMRDKVPAYGGFVRQIDQLRREISGDPGRLAVQRHFAAVKLLPEYKELIRVYSQTVAKIDEDLKGQAR